MGLKNLKVRKIVLRSGLQVPNSDYTVVRTGSKIFSAFAQCSGVDIRVVTDKCVNEFSVDCRPNFNESCDKFIVVELTHHLPH
jgi:hypothetical protein